MELTEGKVGISREPSGTPTPPPLRSVLGPEVEVVAVVAVGPGGGEAARQRGHERDDHSKLAMGVTVPEKRWMGLGCPPAAASKPQKVSTRFDSNTDTKAVCSQANSLPNSLLTHTGQRGPMVPPHAVSLRC